MPTIDTNTYITGIIAELKQQNADLVEALQSIHDWCETDTAADALPFEPPWYKQLRDALAKAKEE